MSASANAFLEALTADGPAADREGKMGLYGWLIGSWEIDVTRILENGSEWRSPGEWHFGWVLEGRAIQDVWITPPRGTPRSGEAPAYYGSTLRIYDPRIDAWHIQWTEPISQTYVSMIGCKQGDDIVQLGKSPEGHSIRWSFSKITPASFLWQGEVSADDGATWRLVVEFTARRIGSA